MDYTSFYLRMKFSCRLIFFRQEGTIGVNFTNQFAGSQRCKHQVHGMEGVVMFHQYICLIFCIFRASDFGTNHFWKMLLSLKTLKIICEN